jgi:hypothetical protein
VFAALSGVATVLCADVAVIAVLQGRETTTPFVAVVFLRAGVPIVTFGLIGAVGATQCGGAGVLCAGVSIVTLLLVAALACPSAAEVSHRAGITVGARERVGVVLTALEGIAEIRGAGV